MSEIPTEIQNSLRDCLVEFSQSFCSTKIDAQHRLFDSLTQKFFSVWKYFHSQDKEKKTHLSSDSPLLRTCLRDLLLANTAGCDAKAFSLMDEENTPVLAKIITGKKWRYQQIAGKNARPFEVIHDFYADMIVREKWSVFKGYSRLVTWLSIYLHAFLRDALNRGMRDTDLDATPSYQSKNANPRDRRLVSMTDGQEIERESDPQKEFVLNSMRNLIQSVFSQLSPRELQFLCLLRANTSEGTTQKELAQHLGVAEYKLTRMKIGLEKHFFDLLEKEVQLRFPATPTDSLRSGLTLEDLLGLLEQQAENTNAPDARNSSHEIPQPHYSAPRGTAPLVRTESATFE